MNLKIEFKKLFYSNLTESEIKQELGLTTMEYRDLYAWVKTSDNLPKNYRRRPTRYGSYNQYSFYLCRHNLLDDEYFIISYSRSKEDAEKELHKIPYNKDYEYLVEQATDENLKRIIEHEYYVKNHNWEYLLWSLQLPYHKFYELLNCLKDEYNDNANSNRVNRFIYKHKPSRTFVVKKIIHGHPRYFGSYKELEEAIRVRDYMESVDWDTDAYQKHIIKDI